MFRRSLLAASILALGLGLAACTAPPYHKPEANIDVTMADYQDCYSKGALEHFTPEIHASINKSTRACMKARGYHSSGFSLW